MDLEGEKTKMEGDGGKKRGKIASKTGMKAQGKNSAQFHSKDLSGFHLNSKSRVVPNFISFY